MNDIVTRKPNELSEEKVSLLLQFENLESLIKAYEQHDWTPDDEMKELISIARDSDKDATRLAAIKTLQARRIEILKHAGLIVSATQTKDMPDGTRTVLSTERVRSLLSGETNYDNTQKETETQIIEGTPQATGQAGDADNPTGRCGPSREASTDSSGEDRGKRKRGPGGRFLRRSGSTGGIGEGGKRGNGNSDAGGTEPRIGDRNDGNPAGSGVRDSDGDDGEAVRASGHTRREPEVPDIPIALDRPPSEALLPGLARSIRKAALSPSESSEAGG